MLDSLEIAFRLRHIHDSGPLYHEFTNNTLVEPWNAFSSLAFFIPVIFWVIRLRGEYNKHRIFLLILPLLFLNGLGSTLFHAFRNNEFFLLLDWMPASLMSITVASYFWTYHVKRWYYGLLIVLACYTLAVFSILALTQINGMREMAPNIGYFFIGCSIFCPLIVQLIKTKFKYWLLIVLSVLFLSLALLSRILDYPSPLFSPKYLPQGTHFLWHIFSSFAVFTLGFFLYYTKKDQLQPTT